MVDLEVLRDKVRATDKEVLKKAILVDGWTIYEPRQFLEAGLDPEIVQYFTKVHRSGNSPKEKIYREGQEIDKLGGVYGLELLEFIAGCFDIRSWKLGRGSRAEHLIQQLMEKLQ